MSHWIRTRATIYALIDPRDELVRYIGCASSPEDRFEQHLYQSGTNEGKRQWIDGLLQEGMVPTLEPLETVRASIVCEREQGWIAHFLLDLDMPLLNRTRLSRKYIRRIESPKAEAVA